MEGQVVEVYLIFEGSHKTAKVAYFRHLHTIGPYDKACIKEMNTKAKKLRERNPLLVGIRWARDVVKRTGKGHPQEIIRVVIKFITVLIILK